MSTPAHPLGRSTALRRYYQRFGVLMVAYAVILVGALTALRTGGMAGPGLYLTAAAPAAPLLAIIAVIGRYLVEEADEFRRALIVQSMLWGLALTLAITTVWGFVEELSPAPRLPLYMVFPIFCGGMGLSQPFLFWRYR